MSAPLKIAQALKAIHMRTSLPVLLNPHISQRIIKTTNFVLHRNFCWNNFIKQAVLRTPQLTTNPLVRCYSGLVLQAVKRQSSVTPRPFVWNLLIRRGLENNASPDKVKKRNRSSGIYLVSLLVFMVGLSHAAVPLYRLFCQATGSGGQSRDAKGHNADIVETMVPVKDRQIKVRFNADLAASMRWNFRPQQTEVVVSPGETALAFYTAKNPTDKPIIGISTYNVVPFEAGQYFNKIQCFCFEEQRLNPHEQVDMPVFFFIDPSYCDDPSLINTNVITLSYTFFEAKEGLQLPLPGYVQNPA